MLANLQTWARNRVHIQVLTDVNLLERRRMMVLFAIAAFKLMNFFGGNWDIQWHVAIGRDSLFIPPHLMVMTAFAGGLGLTWFWICYETFLVDVDAKTCRVIRLGLLRAPLAFWGILIGYTAAFVSGLFDEAWHQVFGIDSSLWSPPHLCILASTMLVDYCLMLGIATAAHRLREPFHWRRMFFWGMGLVGAYMFEAVNFQMSQAFLEAYRAQGAGLIGILFPILIGAIFPLAMLFMVRLVQRFSIVLLVFALAMFFQIISIGIAAVGFALLRPVSIIAEFIQLHPESYLGTAAQFIAQLGFSGQVGVQQTWAFSMSAIPVGLVALLDRWTWARRHWLIAAPVFSSSVVLFGYFWIKQTPLRDYAITGFDVLIGVLLSVSIGLIFGSIGLRLCRIVPE